MDLVPSLVNAAVVAVATAFVWYVTRGQTQELKQRFDRNDARIDRLEDRMDSAITSLRSDITQIALTLGAGPRQQSG